MKRSVLVIIIIIVIAALAIGLWLYMGNQSPSAATTSGTTGSLPPTGNQGSGVTGGNGSENGAGSGSLPPTGVPQGTGNATQFGLVSNEPVFTYFADTGNNIEIVEPNGEIAEVANGQKGQANILSSSQIQNLITAGFSYDGTKALVNFGDPTNPQTSVFDLSTKAWLPLSAGITAPVWSPIDRRIAYLGKNSNGTVTLSTLDLSKAASRPAALLTLAAQDLTISWPTANIVVLSDRPSAYMQGSAWSYNLQTKKLSGIAGPAYGLFGIWSSASNPFGLIWGSDSYGRGGGLTLLSASGATTTVQDLTFLTLPSKCAFNTELKPAAASTPAASSTKTGPKATPTPAPATYLAIYCAVPQDSGSFSGNILPDAYDQMSFFTSDNFYRIHTDTGATDAVLLPTGNFDATDLRVFNNILFFVNRYDQKLYAISLANQTGQ